MRTLVLAIVMACGPADDVVRIDGAASPPTPPDPFVGMFTDPGDLPGEGCTPGTFAGFQRTGYWPALAMQTIASPGGNLRVHVMNDRTDVIATHRLDDDALFVRITTFDGTWHLRAIAACGVATDGTLYGGEVACSGDDACSARPFVAEQLHRIDGEVEGDHLTLLGAFRDWTDGPTYAVRVHRDAAYVARGSDGLHVVSTNDPRAPFALGRYLGVDVVDLELLRGVDGRRYLIAAGTPASHVLEISNPAAPYQVAALAPAQAAFVDGTTGYFIEGGSSKISVYELAVPDRPRLVSTYEPGGTLRWHDGFAANGIAYLGDAAGSGIHVVDFRDSAHPRELTAERPGVIAYAPALTSIDDTTLVLAAEEHAVRILEAGSLAARGTWHLRDAVALRDVRADGVRAYVAHYRDGVRVVDLSDPSAPVQAGYFNTWIEGTGSASPLEGTFAIEVDRERARLYAADSIRGLVILEGDASVFP